MQAKAFAAIWPDSEEIGAVFPPSAPFEPPRQANVEEKAAGRIQTEALTDEKGCSERMLSVFLRPQNRADRFVAAQGVAGSDEYPIRNGYLGYRPFVILQP
jgi:hypothetical protein